MREREDPGRTVNDALHRERLRVESAALEPVGKRGHPNRCLPPERARLLFEAKLDTVVKDVDLASALLAERSRLEVHLLRR